MKRGHRFGAALLGAAVVLGLGTNGAQAANPSYLTLTGPNGVIPGSVVLVGKENTIELDEIHHLIRRDPASGRLAHEPFIMLKAIDKSTPLLYRAMDLNDTLIAVFRFYRPNPSGTGQEVQYYTVTLTQARIVAIEPLTRDIYDTGASIGLLDRERVRMTYGAITIEWTDGGITHQISVN